MKKISNPTPKKDPRDIKNLKPGDYRRPAPPPGPPALKPVKQEIEITINFK